MAFSNVDLPAPLGPTIAAKEPMGTFISTSHNTGFVV